MLLSHLDGLIQHKAVAVYHLPAHRSNSDTQIVPDRGRMYFPGKAVLVHHLTH